MRADWAPLEGTAGVQARAGVRRSVDPNSRPAQSGQDLDRTGRALVELPASAEPWPSVGLADLHPGREAIGEGVVVDGSTHPPKRLWPSDGVRFGTDRRVPFDHAGRPRDCGTVSVTVERRP
jgi:hypothetical protein